MAKMAESAEEHIVLVKTKLSLAGTLTAILTSLSVVLTVIMPWYIVKSGSSFYLLYPWGYVELGALLKGIPGFLGGVGLLLGFDFSRLFMTAVSLTFSAFAKLTSKPSSRIRAALSSIMMLLSGLLMLATIVLFQSSIFRIDIVRGRTLTPCYGLILAHITSVVLIIEAFKLPGNCTLFEISGYPGAREEGLLSRIKWLISKIRDACVYLLGIFVPLVRELWSKNVEPYVRARAVKISERLASLGEDARSALVIRRSSQS